MVPSLLKKVVVASIAAIAGSIFAAPVAKADTIADWTFETSVPAAAGPFSPEVGSGSALGSHTGAAAYSNPAGNGSAHSFSANTWAVGDYFQFQVSTLGYTGVQIAFDQTGSSTGPRDFQLSYSTNGTTFTNIGTAYQVLLNGVSPTAAWSASAGVQSAYTISQSLSSIASVNNAASVYFRISDASTTSIGNGTTAAGGTDRVDNFIVSASPVPLPGIIPATLAGLGLAGVSMLKKRDRRLA